MRKQRAKASVKRHWTTLFNFTKGKLSGWCVCVFVCLFSEQSGRMEVLSLQVIDLPADILFTVLGFLDPISLLSFSLTCRRMWKLLKSENNELWKYSCPWTRDLSDEAFVKICRQGEGEFIRVYSALMRIRKTTRRYRCSRQVRQKLKDNQSDDESALFSRSFRKTCLTVGSRLRLSE